MVITGLGKKINILITTFLTISLVILFFYDISREHTELKKLNEEKLKLLSMSIKKSLQEIMLTGNARIARKWIEGLKGIKEVNQLNIIRTNGKEAFKDNDTLEVVNRNLGRKLFTRIPEKANYILDTNDPRLKQVLKTKKAVGFYENISEIEYYTQFTPIINEERCHKCHGSDHEIRGVLLLSTSMNEINNELAFRRVQNLIFYSLILILIISVLSLLLKKLIVVPLKEIDTFVKGVAKGDLYTEIKVGSRDEIGELSHTINVMVERLKASKEEIDKWNIELQQKITAKTKELQESEQKYHRLFENADDAIFTVDMLTGRIIEANSRGSKLTGYSKEELLSMHVWEIHPENEVEKSKGIIKNTCTNRHYSEENMNFLKKDTTLIPIDIGASLIEYGDKKVIQMRCRDITKRKKLELQLIQSDKMAAIGELAGGLAHQLNNPLVGVLNFAQLLISRMDENDPLRPLADTIERAGMQCHKIIKNLLKFSRESKFGFMPLDINQVIEDVLSMSEKQLSSKGIELIRQLSPDLPQIEGNETQLGQVFLNLINNSIHAMPEGGRLIITTRSITDNQPESGEDDSNMPNKSIVIAIEDSGHGIPKKYINKIFEPFFTTKDKDKGTGLGLSVAYGIIKDHGGMIEVESDEIKRQTIFTINIPIKSNEK